MKDSRLIQCQGTQVVLTKLTALSNLNRDRPVARPQASNCALSNVDEITS